MPATAPVNSRRHAVDWMKNPGKRFSTNLAVAGEIPSAAGDPDEAENRGGDIAQVDGAKPQRHQEVGIQSSMFTCARKTRSKSGLPVVAGELDVELAVRCRDAGGEKK